MIIIAYNYTAGFMDYKYTGTLEEPRQKVDGPSEKSWNSHSKHVTLQFAPTENLAATQAC